MPSTTVAPITTEASTTTVESTVAPTSGVTTVPPERPYSLWEEVAPPVLPVGHTTPFVESGELLDGAYMTPTYGNTLMGLAASAPSGPHNNYKITYHAPQPRAVIQVVDFDDPSRVVGYGETGRVKLTTLTREFFVPGFLERDEGEREQPCELYPWDGISGVRPYRALAESTTVGVY